MEKRILGVILAVLGMTGLIFAGLHFVNGTTGNKGIRMAIFSGLLGAIFFFTGIGLVRNTSDKPT